MLENSISPLYTEDRNPRIFWDAGELDALRAKGSRPTMQACLADVLALVLSGLMGLGSGLLFLAFGGRWDHVSALIGSVTGIATVGGVLIRSLRASPEELAAIE